MGRGLISSSQIASDTICRLQSYLNELPLTDRPKWSLREELLAGEPASRLHEAEISQPLCTAVQIVLVKLLQAARVKLAAVVGHSSGEIAAAYAAGHLSDRDALFISYYRGLHSNLSKSPNGENGAMMAVGTALEDAQDLCDFPELRGRLSVAAVNSETSITLSGDESAIATARIVFEDEGKFARLLRVDTAYHSHHMDACADQYLAALAASNIKVEHRPVQKPPWFSSAHGRRVSPEFDRLESLYWKENMVRPVLFSQALSSVIQQGGPYAVAIEIGPHPALKEPTLQSMEHAGADRIPYIGMLRRGCNNIETVSQTFGFIWTHAGDKAIDFEALLSGGGRKPVLLKNLPCYPWDHQRIYWQESRLSKATRGRSRPVHELLGAMLPDGTEQEVRWRNLLSPKEAPWLQGHKLQGSIVFPASAYIVMALEASLIVSEASLVHTVEVQDLVIGRPIVFDDEMTAVETLFSLTDITREPNAADVISADFKCFAHLNQTSSDMAMIASGSVRLDIGGYCPSASLPNRTHLSRPIDVDADRFYLALAEVGYEYDGPFRGLSAMKRTMGIASALVANPSSLDPNQPLLVHPAMLDSAFQSVFCAYCWPGDGMLSTLHVPNRVARVRINVDLARTSLRMPAKLPLDCVLTPSTSTQIQGDVDIHSSHTPDIGSGTIIQIEGMTAVPISPPTMADDRVLFEDVVWGPAEPKIQSCVEGDLGASLACLVAQVTFRYPHLGIVDVTNADVVTLRILSEVKGAFDSYTVARDPSDSVDVAKTQVMHDRVEFKALDLHSDVLSQGFPAHSYGLAVVSGLEFVPDLLETALRQLRRLLKPGGYLLLSQPFGSQSPPSTGLGPPLSISQFESVLLEACFSGIDSIRDIGGATIIISLAVNDRISALRKPLEFTWVSTASKELAIICGSSQDTVRAAKKLESLLCKHFKSVMLVEAVDIANTDVIPAEATIVSLADLDDPILRSLTAEKLEALKILCKKSETILWLTRGCLSEDPYANMMAGFGRTLLLESPYLQIQFLDIDPKLSVPAEVVAEALLRLFAAKEWGSSDISNEDHPVWTIEPELALAEDGVSMIPRIIPSQERNCRYNSRRREITKDVDLGASVVEIEFDEYVSSYALLERSMATAMHSPRNANSTGINVRYSCLFALRVEGLGYVFPVLGRMSHDGRRVLALSETQASRVSVPHGLYVSCPEEVSEDMEAPYLSSFVASLYAFAVFAQVGPGDVILVLEAPPALEAALLEMAKKRCKRIYFLSISQHAEALSPPKGVPRLILHSNASLREIKSMLPLDVSIFVSHPRISGASGDVRSRIASCLPRFHRHIDFPTLWSRISAVMSSPSADVEVESELRSAISHANGLNFHEASVISLDNVVREPQSTHIDIISWLNTTTVNVRVKPVDSGALFAEDRTYLLVGLMGDLGKSLTNWMVEHGAKYIVLTSRNPRIDKQWLEALESKGAVVRIFAKYVFSILLFPILGSVPVAIKHTNTNYSDITDKPALGQVIEEVRKILPPLAGVANGAMVLDDVPVDEMTVERMLKVTEPKVQGSNNLDELLGKDPLDFFILFSSVAAVVGNRGQSSYSAANAFMCSLAAKRRARGLAASVIHIGAVVGTGYLTREVGQGVQDYLRKAGYLWMSESDFHQVFAEGVLASPPESGKSHEIMSGLNMENDARNTAVWYNNPKFQHCVFDSDHTKVLETNSKQNLSLATRVASASSPAEVLKVISGKQSSITQLKLVS